MVKGVLLITGAVEDPHERSHTHVRTRTLPPLNRIHLIVVAAEIRQFCFDKESVIKFKLAEPYVPCVFVMFGCARPADRCTHFCMHVLLPCTGRPSNITTTFG